MMKRLIIKSMIIFQMIVLLLLLGNSDSLSLSDRKAIITMPSNLFSLNLPKLGSLPSLGYNHKKSPTTATCTNSGAIGAAFSFPDVTKNIQGIGESVKNFIDRMCVGTSLLVDNIGASFVIKFRTKVPNLFELENELRTGAAAASTSSTVKSSKSWRL